jgi:hypothetical protein
MGANKKTEWQQHDRVTDDRENPTLKTIFAEIAKPMIFSAVVMFLLSPVGMPWLLLGFIVVVGLGAAPAFIWLVVRHCNRRDDPRHQKPPPDTP